MFEKTLHAGNIATSFALVATAADITLAGGAATTISAALSTLALFRKGDRTSKDLARQMADAMESAFAAASLPQAQLKHVAQMLALFPVTEDDLARGSLDAATIAANMHDRIAGAAKDPAHRTNAALAAYVAVLTDTLTPVLARPAGTDPLQAAILKELLSRSDQTGRADKLRDEGITEKAIIRLAQRIAAETDDIGQAWLELQNAMDIAVRVQAEGQIGSNHGDFVDTVLKRVADLAKDGDYAAAGAEIDTALDQAEAQMSRLLSSGVEVALLNRDTARAARLLIRKSDLDAGGIADFATLRALQEVWFETGRNQGRNLDSALAIDLAHLVLPRAATTDERGAAGVDLGAALATLGEREAGTDRLQQAVAAYRDALREFTRDRVPLDWARTQMNLGAALATLGGREAGTGRLQQAVAAYRDALREFTRDRAPLDWARTQMNLGAALTTLGEREAGTDSLEQAVTAYREALKERTRDRVPLQWAKTQMNLGAALTILGEREAGTDRLQQAVTAYREALNEVTRDRASLDWATTQMNLGSALTTLGAREAGTDRLQQAAAACRDALREITRDRVPLDWAMTQANLSSLELAFFDKTQDDAHLDVSLGHARAAKEVFVAAQADHYIGQIDQTIAEIQSRRDALG